MKNRVLAVATLLSFLAFPVLSWGQGKIGIIGNFQEVVFSTGEGRKAFGDLQKKYQPRQQELQRQQQEINALQDQLQKQSATLSDEERARLSRDLEEKQKMFKRATEDFNADAQADQNEVLRRIGQKMQRLVAEYAQQNGYTLIVDASQLPVFYAAPEINLSEEIIKRYDAANPMEAPSTSVGNPPAAATTKPAVTPPAPKPAVNPPKPAANPPKPADKPKQ